MRKLMALTVVSFLFLLSGCGLFDSLVPDVDTEYSKTFTVNITNNSGYTDPALVDVKNSSDYEDFKNHIDGFNINKITWEITNYNAPDDMYFSGKVNAWDIDSTKNIKVADISRVKLSDIAAKGEQDNVDEIVKGTDEIEKWLQSPGSFYFDAGYVLTDPGGNPYVIESEKYSFKLKLTFYVTVKTGAK